MVCVCVNAGANAQIWKYLPGPKSSRTARAHKTLWATSKYGNIFSLVTWLAKSRKASGSIFLEDWLDDGLTKRNGFFPFGSPTPQNHRIKNESSQKFIFGFNAADTRFLLTPHASVEWQRLNTLPSGVPKGNFVLCDFNCHLGWMVLLSEDDVEAFRQTGNYLVTCGPAKMCLGTSTYSNVR